MVPEPLFSKLAENCVGADVLAGRGVVCISKEQLDHHFVRNTQLSAFQSSVCYRRCVRNDGFRSKRDLHFEAFHMLSFFPRANMYLVW